VADRYGASVVIDRSIDEVFAFLADGENDRKFSPRVLEIAKTSDGPPGVGTVYKSKVKDGALKSDREFEYTEFEQPTKIRWSERSKNMITVPEGGYDLEPEGGGTKLSFFNEFEGHGFGKLLTGFALRQARKQADDFASSIKSAVEAE